MTVIRIGSKYIYALADWDLVVSSSWEKGGTWAGAVEALKQLKKPVFVRLQEDVPEGNRKLLDIGAQAFPPEPWTNLCEMLAHPDGPLRAAGGIPAPDSLAYSKAEPAAFEFAADQDEEGQCGKTSAFTLVLPLLLAHLHRPRRVRTLATLLGVGQGQLQDWLKQAVADGKVKKERRAYVATGNEPGRGSSEPLSAPEQGDRRQSSPATAYPVILPLLLSHLDQHRSVATLASLLHVRDYQAKDWLKEAVADRKVAKVNDRYVALKAL